MALFLDSANVDDVRQAMELGMIAGITTNPTLMARTGRPAEEVVVELCGICPGPVFHQLTSTSLSEMRKEARRFHALASEQVVLKIHCNLTGLKLTAELSPHMPCAVTGIFSAAQSYLACQAGARYAIPYVNRATRMGGNGIELVQQMAGLIELEDTGAEIVAASLKSPSEVVEALLAGAHHVTVPLQIIEAMAEHEGSTLSWEEFARAAAGSA